MRLRSRHGWVRERPRISPSSGGHMLRKFAMFVSVATALAGFGLAAPQAGAAPASSCAHFSGSATISPGLLLQTNRNQTIDSKGTITGCTGIAKKSGTFTSHTTGTGKCVGTPAGTVTQKGTTTTKWNTGKTSVASIQIIAKRNPTVVDIKGTVTSGLFKGKHIATQLKFTPKSGENCSAAHPVKHVTFVNTKPL